MHCSVELHLNILLGMGWAN